MSYHITMTVEWWDVTEVMTLNEIVQYCEENDVLAQMRDGKVCVPVYSLEEGEEA